MGLALVTLAGLLWAVTGGLIGRSARANNQGVAVLALASLVATVSAALCMPKFKLLASGAPGGWPLLALTMGAAGAIGAYGTLLLQAAMRGGQQAVMWAIAQSALIVPFLAGVFFWGDIAPLHRAGGVAAVLLGMAFLGFAKHGDDASGQIQPHRAAFGLALIAFVCLGASQTLASSQGHWCDRADPGNLRVVFFSLGATLGYMLSPEIRNRNFEKSILLPAIALGANTALSQAVFFAGLDRLKAAGMGCIGYPLAVGTCIFGFALYSRVFLREKTNLIQSLGLLAGIAGIVLVAL